MIKCIQLYKFAYVRDQLNALGIMMKKLKNYAVGGMCDDHFGCLCDSLEIISKPENSKL